MSTVEVLGYSERGIINSIVFYLREQPKQHIQDFINLLGIDDVFFNDVCKYTFLNEQSFSQLGSNDLTIIAEGKDEEKRVIFIEGKVKTYHKKTFSLNSNFEKLKNGETFKSISSNIFVQLYYKYILSQVMGENKNDTEFLKIPDVLKKNNRNGEKGARKTGENGIVKKAIEKIKGAKEYYYVAILPIPKSNELLGQFENLNKTLFKNQPMETKNVTQTFWGDIETHFKNVEQIKDNFDFNYDEEKNKSQIY